MEREVPKDTRHPRRTVLLGSTAVDIVSGWDIPRGGKISEIGCGQVDCTAVLAELVGPEGHVTAIDPGPSDYGMFVNIPLCK